MAGEGAAVRAGEGAAEGLIAKAARSVLRDAAGPVGRDAASATARDTASATARDAASATARDAASATARDTASATAKSAGRSGARNAGKDVGAAARRHVPVRNASGLPQTPGTAEARRAFDKLHGTEPDWGRVTAAHHGPAPGDMVRPHGHHIVFKEGRPGPVRDVLAQSKQILERHDIDWYTGGDNLIWAPNRGHSLANAEAVRDALAAAEPGGRDAVLAALRNAGRSVFGGRP